MMIQQTIKTNVIGTLNMLGLAKRVGARLGKFVLHLYVNCCHNELIYMISLSRILLTSTSEVYGDPLVHPQPESYWGNVNPIGMCSSHSKPAILNLQYGLSKMIVSVNLVKFSQVVLYSREKFTVTPVFGMLTDGND